MRAAGSALSTCILLNNMQQHYAAGGIGRGEYVITRAIKGLAEDPRIEMLLSQYRHNTSSYEDLSYRTRALGSFAPREAQHDSAGSSCREASAVPGQASVYATRFVN